MKNTIKIFLFIFLGLLGICGHTQPFQNENGNFNLDEIAFDPWFISSNNIKSVSIEYSRKLPGSPIESISDEDLLIFDEAGRCISGYRKRSTRLGTDSMSFAFSFLGDELVAFQSNDRLGSYSEHYTREASAPGSMQIDFKRNDTFINQELHRSEKANDTLTVTRVYNSDDIHYKTIRTYSDRYGRILEEVEDFQFSGRVNTERREYNEKGWVSVCYKNLGDRSEYTTYEYSALGELLMVHYYRNKEIVHTLEILYEDGMPDALIKKEHSTNRLRIAKFEFAREN